MTKKDQTQKTKGINAKKMSKVEYRLYIDFIRYLSEGLCQICGGTAHDVHHSRYGNYGRTKSDFSIMSICRSCHEKCHKEKHGFNLQAIDIGEENYEVYKKSRVNIQ